MRGDTVGIEGVRRDTGHPHVRMWPFAWGEQAQGQVLLGGSVRLGSRFGWPLLVGNALLLEGLVLLLPCAELRGRRRKGNAHGEGDFGRHQHAKDQTVSPERAPTWALPFLR